MASISKNVVRSIIHSQTVTKLTSVSISNKLRTRLFSSGGTDGGSSYPTTMYDCRKLGHNLSTDNVQSCFPTLGDIPSGVFRPTHGEVLGLGAAKCAVYQNPEYFSFHHMSFYDLNIGLRQYRRPCPDSKRKPN